MITLESGATSDSMDTWSAPDDAFTDEPERHAPREAGSPQPGFAAGMALCIPALSLLGLLYSLLK